MVCVIIIAALAGPLYDKLTNMISEVECPLGSSANGRRGHAQNESVHNPHEDIPGTITGRGKKLK